MPKAGASAAPDSLIGFDDVAPADSFRYDSIWPLHLLDVHDTEQVDLLYSLLARLPHIIHSYLSDYIFPEMMRFQDLRLSANGQELGGDLIFQRRLGFSGTPSDLLSVAARQARRWRRRKLTVIGTCIASMKRHAASALPSP